jgi:hypothetical protein
MVPTTAISAVPSWIERGGIIGNDARVHHVHLREVDVTGIDNHELNSLNWLTLQPRS